MSIGSELRKNLSRYPKIDEDVYDLGGYVAVLTPRKAYIGSDFYYCSGLVEKEVSRRLEGPWYVEKAKGAFEAGRRSPWPEKGSDVIILKGGHYHWFLGEWNKVGHRKFLRELTRSPE
jgi:hypothetical protein